MENEFERLDLRALLESYMKESKEFSAALKRGASWKDLQEKRLRIKTISTIINKKYEAAHGAQRRRDQPPHGD